ncbi:hypothetical protein YC2023_040981 [Brassica napus]
MSAWSEAEQMTNWTRADVVRDRQGPVGRDGYGLYRKTDWALSMASVLSVLDGWKTVRKECMDGLSDNKASRHRNACDSGSARLSPKTRFVVKGDMTAAVEKRQDYGAADVGEVIF